MKFLSNIKSKLDPFIKKILALKELPVITKLAVLFGKVSPTIGLALFFALTLIFISSKFASNFIFNQQERIEDAIEYGNRVEISLINGTMKVRQKQDTNKKLAKNIGEKKSQNKDSDTEDKEEEKSDQDKNDLSWVTADYIGPRLPDGILSVMLGEEVGKKTLAISRVSIKEISEKPIVIIIIKGLGLSSSSTKEALQLPKEITMGYSPYSPSLDVWVKKTRARGHEVVLNIPMETSNFKTNNPGPYSLLTQSSTEDNTTRLKMLLNLTSDYEAVYSENEEIFTHSINSIQPTLETLRGEGKYFVYGGGYSNFSLIQVAKNINYPLLVSDLVLDDDISTAAINKKFKEMEKIAKEKGYVVVMAHPYPITIRLLQAWLPKTKEKGLLISPVSLLLGKIIKDE